MSDDYPPIVEVIQHYFPDWEPPEDNPPWMKTLCPFHGESIPSATVSYELNSFKCFACEAHGDIVTLIMRHEEIPYAEAKCRAEEILGDRYLAVSPKPARQPSRRTFGGAGTAGSQHGTDRHPVQTGIRGRTSPWT